MKTLTLILCLTLLGCKNSKTSAQNINTKTPEYKAYMAQEHRFALNGCELTYNEKSFHIGTLEDFKNTFGDYSVSGIDDVFIESNKIGVSGVKKPNSKIKSIAISFEKGVKYIKIQNIIISKNDLMQDFISKSSKFNFEDFEIESYGYSYEYTECSYFFKSSVDYERIGSGHLYTRGDWLLDKTKPVESISISYKKK